MSTLPQVEDRPDSAEAFSAWAEAYDQQQNPLLALEERYLKQLLPNIAGRDILDAGCGTGRWLAQLSLLKPRSLHGVDPSPEMLAKAASKHIPHTRLSVSSCISLPSEDSSVDVLLSSFVLSYVDDLNSAVREFARVARPGCEIFLSDMHPETAALLNWKRGFRAGEVEIKLPAKRRSISEILDAFISAGFVERAVVEPAFGAAEEHIFAAHDKLDRFAEAKQLPAIYLLQLSKPHDKSAAHKPNERMQYLLHGGHCALGPHEKIPASVMVDAGNIATISSQPVLISKEAKGIDLTGYLLLPGLINAHDHLEFALFPRLGKGSYENTKQWAEDIHQNDAEVIATHQTISKSSRLWWGGIRNLLAGVTTVCHHNPIDPCLVAPDFPVRIVARFGWAHSLAFDADMQSAYTNTPDDQPFIVHGCEGIDKQSKEELGTLHALGMLDQRTVLVHGLALDEEGAALLNARDASLITCPSSNDFLFGKVPAQELLESVTRLALGSDSPLTAAGDLLDEVRFAADACGLAPQHLYSMVTTSPASILRLDHGEGSIRPGVFADMIAVRDQQREPAEILCSLSADDIELVLLSGRVQLASAAMFDRLPPEYREGLEPLSVDGEIRWLRAPIEELLQEAESILTKDAVCLGGKILCRPRS